MPENAIIATAVSRIGRKAFATGIHVATGRAAVVLASEASILQVARMLRKGEQPIIAARRYRVAA